MKIAVLFTGELRAFEHARKLYTFLDQPELDIDVYVNTWTTSIRGNTKRNGFIYETESSEPLHVTESYIQGILNRPATIQILDPAAIPEDMIEPHPMPSWITGIRLVEQSGIKYDYIWLMRPDLCFSNNPRLIPEQIQQFANSNKIGITNPGDIEARRAEKFFPDFSFFGSAENIKKLANEQIVGMCKAASSPKSSWHNILWTHVHENCGFTVVKDPIFPRAVIPVREPITGRLNWYQALDNWYNWLSIHSPIRTCIVGWFQDLYLHRENFKLLDQSGLNLYNYAVFSPRNVNGEHVRISKQEVNAAYGNHVRPLGYIDYANERLISGGPQNEFEKAFLQWMVGIGKMGITPELSHTKSARSITSMIALVKTHVFRSAQVQYDTEIIRQNKIYDLNFNKIWVSKNHEGRYNLDYICGSGSRVMTLINDRLIQRWVVAKESGMTWRDWWHDEVSTWGVDESPCPLIVTPNK